ncbi:hypothetical protein [Novosphingobium sp.]|uniref:hypothetical protein n=1 Tax=Novosphingobium sp. TaxID=1874826 RepID=UPI002FDB6DB4
MTDRRTFLASFALAPIAIAAPAIAVSPAVRDHQWLALLAAERQTSDAFAMEADANEEAYDRFYDMRKAALEELERDAGQPWRFIQARPTHEQGDARTEAGIRDYNADCERRRTEQATLDERLRLEMGLDGVDERYDVACDAHYDSVRAIIAYPSRDPDIIAHKLRLILNLGGVSSGDIRPLLASINGEAVA